MKWKNDEHWCVLEGNVATKAFRIIYSDPRDGQSKVRCVRFACETPRSPIRGADTPAAHRWAPALFESAFGAERDGHHVGRVLRLLRPDAMAT